MHKICYSSKLTVDILRHDATIFIRYVANDECHLYQSTALSAHTCRNIGGTFVAANHTCYYHEYACSYYNVGGQCHPNVQCDTFSCETCHTYGGYYESRTRWYVHAEYTVPFLPRDAMLSAVYAVVVCPSVCVCVSVTLQYCIKTAKHRITQTALHDSPMTLVF